MSLRNAYAEFKAVQRDLKKQEAQKRREQLHQEYQDRFKQNYPKLYAKQAARIEKERHERLKKSQGAALAIEKRQAALQVSIETEAVYRESVAETRRRQQKKDELKK